MKLINRWYTVLFLLCYMTSTSSITFIDQALNKLTSAIISLTDSIKMTSQTPTLLSQLSKKQSAPIKQEPLPLSSQRKYIDVIQTESKRVLFDPIRLVLGINEQQLLAVTDDNATAKQIAQREALVIYNTDKQRYELINQRTGQHWIAGVFTEYSVKDLRDKTDTINRGKTKISIVEGLDNPEGLNKEGAWFRPLLDTAALQMNSENADAVFQVASNFNGLEGGGATRLSEYMTPGMYVQGEAAALSAAAAALLRMFFIIKKDGKLYKQMSALTGYKEINFLSAVPEIPVKYGYPTGAVSPIFATLNAQQYDAFVQKIKVGFHQDISVTSGLGPMKKAQDFGHGEIKAIMQNNPDAPTINQVFTAAFNLGYSSSPAVINAARIILDAAYEGTVRVTAYKNKKKLFLTLIGGGVFNNKLSWIQSSLIKAFDIAENFGLDITVVVYSLGNFAQQERDDFRKAMLTYVRKTNGSYMQFTHQGAQRLDKQLVQEQGNIIPPIIEKKITAPQKEITQKCVDTYWGLSARQGDRSSMEDAHVHDAAFHGNKNQSTFAVFDGHGGSQAAFIAANRSLGMYIRKSGDVLPNALKNFFHLVDKEIIEKTDAGTTAAMVHMDCDNLFIAWAGDSRVVVARNGVVMYATEDHKPNKPEEKKRIEDNGGVVTMKGVPRVNGLAVSRALGDRNLKTAAELIIATPEIHTQQIKKDDIIIIACDGIWDVIDNQQAVDIVQKALKESIATLQKKYPKSPLLRNGLTLEKFIKEDGNQEHCILAARALRDSAYVKGSSDNLSVEVILIR